MIYGMISVGKYHSDTEKPRVWSDDDGKKYACGRGHPLPTPYPTRHLRHLDPRAFGARYSAPRLAPVVQSKKSLNYIVDQIS